MLDHMGGSVSDAYGTPFAMPVNQASVRLERVPHFSVRSAGGARLARAFRVQGSPQRCAKGRQGSVIYSRSLMRIATAALFAAGLAVLPPSDAKAECSFPLAWPFCVAGAAVNTVASIASAPFYGVSGSPYYYNYYRYSSAYHASQASLPPALCDNHFAVRSFICCHCAAQVFKSKIRCWCSCCPRYAVDH
jgi:hypothetical protein